jgi:hypothetical protein
MFDNLFLNVDGTETQWEDVLMALYLEVYGSDRELEKENGYPMRDYEVNDGYLKKMDNKRTIN